MVPERILVFCDAFCLENVLTIDFHFDESLHLVDIFAGHKVFTFDEVEGDLLHFLSVSLENDVSVEFRCFDAFVFVVEQTERFFGPEPSFGRLKYLLNSFQGAANKIISADVFIEELETEFLVRRLIFKLEDELFIENGVGSVVHNFADLLFIVQLDFHVSISFVKELTRQLLSLNELHS